MKRALPEATQLFWGFVGEGGQNKARMWVWRGVRGGDLEPMGPSWEKREKMVI